MFRKKPAQATLDSEAIARELSSLRQALEHLTTVERDLEARRVQLQAQIREYNEQITSARQANRTDLVTEIQAKATQVQPELASVHEQMGRVVARQKEITNRQFELLMKQTSAAQAPIIPFRKPHRRRRVLIGLSVAVTLLVLVALGLGQILKVTPPGLPLPGLTQAQASPTPTLKPTFTPTPTLPPIPAFKPDGTGPTIQQCENALGAPCYSPEAMQQASNLTALYKQGYDGKGQTIVILGTGNTTTLEADLHHFDKTWGLPDPPNFQILKQATVVPYTCADGEDDLALENTLDVEWAHSIAPGANIVLVLGSNSSGIDAAEDEDHCGFYGIMAALEFALDNHLGQIVTLSYGGSELGDVSESPEDHAQEKAFYQQADITFQEAANQGVTVLASSGDQGVTNPNDVTKENSYWDTPNVGWPADDPYVLAVGGTNLHVRDASGTYGSEEVWNDGKRGGAGGGGLSSVFPQPDYQKSLPHQDLLKGQRALPDVSWVAEPSLALYASFETGIMGKVSSRWKHWDIYGGTSASAPCWAGLIAIGNQMRGKPLGLIQPALYSLNGKGLHDITKGNNSYGGVTGFSAGTGFDLATGWGTPIADQFLRALIAASNRLSSSQ